MGANDYLHQLPSPTSDLRLHPLRRRPNRSVFTTFLRPTDSLFLRSTIFTIDCCERISESVGLPRARWRRDLALIRCGLIRWTFLPQRASNLSSVSALFWTRDQKHLQHLTEFVPAVETVSLRLRPSRTGQVNRPAEPTGGSHLQDFFYAPLVSALLLAHLHRHLRIARSSGAAILYGTNPDWIGAARRGCLVCRRT